MRTVKLSRQTGQKDSMNKNDDNTTPIAKAIEAVLASLNPLTAAIFTGVTTYRSEKEMRFVKDVIVAVNERVYRLEQKLDKEYMKSEDYMNFLYKTLRMAASDARKEKQNLFANIMVNAAVKELADENDGRKYLYDETIDKIDEKLFEFLLRASVCDLEGFGLEAKGWRGTDDELKLLGVDDKTFQFNAEYLLGVGVMVRLPKFEMKGETGHLFYHEEYFVTQYGKEFVEYVRERG